VKTLSLQSKPNARRTERKAQRVVALRWAHVCFGVVVMCALSACVAQPPELTARLSSLRATITRVAAAGALRCAPRELALARANYEFAYMELSQGDRVRARQHVDLAEENIGAAQVLTPEHTCNQTHQSANEDGEKAPHERVDAPVQQLDPFTSH